MIYLEQVLSLVNISMLKYILEASSRTLAYMLLRRKWFFFHFLTEIKGNARVHIQLEIKVNLCCSRERKCIKTFQKKQKNALVSTWRLTETTWLISLIKWRVLGNSLRSFFFFEGARVRLNINGSFEIVFNCHFSVWCHLTDPNSWHFHKKKRSYLRSKQLFTFNSSFKFWKGA